jgi:hypothetical protein
VYAISDFYESIPKIDNAGEKNVRDANVLATL